MKNEPQLYWKGSPLDEGDYSEIAQEFKISYDLVAEAVAQIKAKGEPLYAQFAGTARERIRSLATALGETPEVDEQTFPIVDPDEEEEQEEPVEAPESDKEALAPAPLTEAQEVVSDAAISLVRALADPLDGCFIVEEDGCCVINPENPPEITHAYQVVSNVIKLQDLAPAVNDKSSWMLGSIVASLEEYFGEDFSISQVCETEEKSYNTICQKVGVYKAFKDKRYNLSYSHHQEAHYAKIADKSKQLILSKAEKFDLSAKNVRGLCSVVKAMGDDQTIKNIRSKDQAMSLIEAHKTIKVPYLIYNEGQWTRKSGLFGEIPEGQVVIDMKNWKAYAKGESADILRA